MDLSVTLLALIKLRPAVNLFLQIVGFQKPIKGAGGDYKAAGT